MNTVITHTKIEADSLKLRPIDCDYEQLHATIREAANSAAQSGRAVLACYIQPIATLYDPIDWFGAAQQIGCAESFYWEQPSQQALVGLGSAAMLTSNGASRFTDVSTAWNALLEDAVIRQASGELPACFSGPLLFGGFAFDPQAPRTTLWRDFPDGLLILPRILLARQSDCAVLIINTLVQPSSNSEREASELLAIVNRLRRAIEQPSTIPNLHSAAKAVVIQDLLPASEWMNLVADCVSDIRQGTYAKVMLARGVKVTAPESTRDFDATAVMRRLRESYPGAYLFALRRGDRCFVGATPEQLVSAHAGHIETMALAGTAPRGVTEQEDQRIGEELLLSAKNQDEHSITLTMIRDALATLCTSYWIAGEPRLLKLKNVQHLETAITGKLKAGRNILDVVESLHPTPAVGGFPREPALAAIRGGEQLDRGWYAGPIGWLDMNGNGEFAVALRSGLLKANSATLFAGCGIVADSDPQSEYEESCLKFEVVLHALGGVG